jgi:DNA repair photolyase
VHFSVTTLDNRLASKLEPRASAPHSKLRAMKALSDAGVPVGVMVAPVIPMITDMEMEHILEAAYEHGAREAGYTLLRLPNELKDIWREWLELHYPDRAAHVMSLVQQMRGGKDYRAEFGTRMTGTGVFAQLVQQRFRKARARLGYGRFAPLDASRFTPPRRVTPQGELF